MINAEEMENRDKKANRMNGKKNEERWNTSILQIVSGANDLYFIVSPNSQRYLPLLFFYRTFLSFGNLGEIK